MSDTTWHEQGRKIAAGLVTQIAVYFIKNTLATKVDAGAPMVEAFHTAITENRGMGYLDSLSLDDQAIVMKAALAGLIQSRIEVDLKSQAILTLLGK